MTLLDNPAFLAFAIASVALCTNLAFLWACSGAVRGRTRTALNAEDAASVVPMVGISLRVISAL